MADGITEITGLEHLDRGYSKLEEKLTNLGATVWREKLTDQEIEQLQNS
ncbi:hypothetical protein QKW52_11305 [Bacillus sonorensis]|nr:hypothetical protein [Bacillus sonorensis]